MRCENCNRVYRGLNQAALNDGAGFQWFYQFKQHWTCWSCSPQENPYLAWMLGPELG